MERPECAKLIGAIAMTWSYIEQVLALHYSTLVMGAKGGTDAYIYQIALETFDAGTSISHKKELFLIAARRRFDKGTVERIDTVLSKIVSLATKRNAVIHGRWRVSPDYPDALLHERRIGLSSKSVDIYDQPRLISILSAMLKAQGQLDSLFFSVLLPLLGNSRPVHPL